MGILEATMNVLVFQMVMSGDNNSFFCCTEENSRLLLAVFSDGIGNIDFQSENA
jgi:hypothetical protein